MEQPLLSIIYVNFNSTDLLIASIGSLRKNTLGLPYEVIIVDNSSNETEVRRLTASLACHCEESATRQSQRTQDCHTPQSSVRNDKSRAPEIKFIKNPDNKGFGSANNLGSKKANGQFLLFLNPDTLVVDDSIVKMVDYLKNHHEVGALTPLLYNPDGQLQKHFYANFMSLWGITFGRWTGRDDKKMSQISSPGNGQRVTGNAAVPVSMVSGAAMMVKRELFVKIGGFDEKFFMYLEDDDLCFRLHRSGYQNRVLTTAKITHLEGRSSASSDKKKWYYQSQDYYFRKHYGIMIMLLMKLIRVPYKWLRLLDK